MEITTDPLAWDSDDSIALRIFLATRTGARMIPKLAEAVPGLLPKGDTNEILIRAGEVRGYQGAIATILGLTTFQPTPAPPADAYPPLDSDSAWADGQQISPRQPPTQ